MMCRSATERGRRYSAQLLLIVLVFILAAEPTRRIPPAYAQQAASAAAQRNAPLRLEFIPRDALLVLATRPNVLLNRPLLKPLRDTLAGYTEGKESLGVAPEELEEITLAVLAIAPLRGSSLLIVRAKNRQIATTVVKSLADTGERRIYNGQAYLQSGRNVFVYQPDERTVVYARDEFVLRRSILAGERGPADSRWTSTWELVAAKDAAAIINSALLRSVPTNLAGNVLRDFVVGARDKEDYETAYRLAFETAPLWQRSEYVVADLSISDRLQLHAASRSVSVKEAEQVHTAAMTLISLARTYLSHVRYDFAARNAQGGPAQVNTLDLLDAVLEKAAVVQDGVQVEFSAGLDASTAKQMVALMAPMVRESQQVTQQQRGQLNLRQLGLALHNYHDSYRAFPAAVQIGPKNTPRSWRVSLLPFLEQGELYEQYRQDEPWDSENNKKVLAQMPDVYRHPADNGSSTNTSYFALVGPRTPFPGNQTGRINGIIDGLSNTILLVEAKRDIPWTKPEDIPYAEDKALPQLGGWYDAGFNVALGDTTTRFLPRTISEELLRYMIMCDEGQPVEFPE